MVEGPRGWPRASRPRVVVVTISRPPVSGLCPNPRPNAPRQRAMDPRGWPSVLVSWAVVVVRLREVSLGRVFSVVLLPCR